MSILGGLEVYRGKYEESGRTNFSSEDISAVANAKVVNSKYGLSACFFMKSGGTTYIPLAEGVVATAGDNVPMEEVEVLTLSRAGDNDILRLEW